MRATSVFLSALLLGSVALSTGQAPFAEPQSEALAILSPNTPCRIVPYITTCGLPLYLANFQVSCDAWRLSKYIDATSNLSTLPMLQGKPIHAAFWWTKCYKIHIIEQLAPARSHALCKEVSSTYAKWDPHPHIPYFFPLREVPLWHWREDW